MNTVKRFLPVSVLFLAAAGLGQNPKPETAASPESPELAARLERVGNRVHQFFLDLRGLAWTNTVRRQILNADETPKEKPTERVYDMIVRLQAPRPGDNFAPFYIRESSELVRRDGKPVTGKNRTPLPEPEAGQLGAVAFLLPGPRASYRFSYAGEGNLEGRRTLIVDVSPPQRSMPRVEWDRSFAVFGVRYDFRVFDLRYNGRIWMDPATDEVLQMEWRSDPFEFNRPHGNDKLTYEIQVRSRFQSRSFENPRQTLLLPQTIESVRTTRGRRVEFPIVRVVQTFDNYKRFTGDIKINP